jgi:hypothetical protein
LHLEARYNYEDRDAASAWIGYNLSVGEKLTLDITPMLGGVFGNTSGIAPGYHLTLSWKKLGFYTEGEYVLNTRERADSFFYSWSELTLSPLDWFRLGLAAQKTRAYKSERDIQRGFFLGVSLGKVEVSGYVFNPNLDRPTHVLSVSGEF